MSSYEHQIVQAAFRLEEAMDASDEVKAQLAVVELCDLVKTMKRDRRSDAPVRESRVEYEGEVRRGR
jgi:hypothetical protein